MLTQPPADPQRSPPILLPHTWRNRSDSPSKDPPWVIAVYDNTPFSGIAFLIAAKIANAFSSTLAITFAGVGTGIIITKLVKNIVRWYDNKLLVNLTKEIYEVNIKYKYLQVTALIIAIAASYLYTPLGFTAAALTGVYGGLLIDVETAKMAQQAARRKLKLDHS